MSEVFLYGGPERPLHEAWMLKPGLPWKSKMLKMPESWNTSQRKLPASCGTRSRERYVLQSMKLKEVGDLNSVLISYIKMEILEFTLLGFCLAIPHYASFLPFQNGNGYSVTLYARSMWSSFLF